MDIKDRNRSCLTNLLDFFHYGVHGRGKNADVIYINF